MTAPMKRVVSVALTAAMAIAPLAGVGTAVAAEPAAPAPIAAFRASPRAAAIAAGGWTTDPNTTIDGDILQMENGWLHFKAAKGTSNRNSERDAAQYPAVAIKDGTIDLSQPGSYTATVKTPQAGTLNRFGFYLGYKNPGNGLFLGYDAQGWFWQKYENATGAYYGGSRIAAPEANAEVTVEITWDGTTATLKVNGKQAFDPVSYADMGGLTDKLAMKAGYWTNPEGQTDIYLQDDDTPEAPTYALSGTVTDAEGAALEGATVHLDDESDTTDGEGAYSFEGVAAGEHTLRVSAEGYESASRQVTVTDGDLTVDPIALTRKAAIASETLTSDAMTVTLNRHFPSVLQYEMKDGGAIMHGQSEDLRVVEINGHKVTLTDDDVDFHKDGDAKATYTLRVKDAANSIDATLTVEIAVEDNTLDLTVTKVRNNLVAEGTAVKDEEHPIQTISFPNQSLVSVRSTQQDAQFSGAVMSSDTNKTGDEHFAVADGMKALTDRDYMYGFVSGDGLSAGVWSNSEHNGRVVAAPVQGGSQNTRIYATTQDVDGATSLGLASAPWYWHRTVTDSKRHSYTIEQTDLPKLSVAITGDANDDGTVNWEDGAIAFRDIMNNPYKSEEVPELVAWRIAMNFGSQAQNPFLTTLDNVKKVALNTDGLGQSVLLKGYGSEGHDSGHPDYADIGKRIGGAKDMNTLMKKGSEYGARFGIHVNASEMYPEAKAFTEDSVRRNAQGGLSYGWNWLDQGVGIDGIWDLGTGSREARFDALKEEVGDNMDFIYLDVWGNLTSSSSEDSWETRKMSKMINDNGWRMTTEWGSGNEYDSTFQHWAADLTYGGSTSKGENSQIMRFLRNHQKDSWVGDYPSYGGAANAPLLGGYNMKDFEGWQGRNDYDAYIENLFTHDVSTKFIQHFKVSRWVNNPLDATSVQDPNTNGGNEFIELRDADGNVVTLARGSNDQGSAAYRQRTITFNGVQVASGAVSRGDGSGTGDESYLLPWLWDAKTGKRVKASDEKLYHWNTTGGTTTWTLPEEWQSLKNVKVYKLTDLGKTDERTVPVVGGVIEIEAEAETPYVVYKGDAQPKQLQITWSEGMHIVDAGFNGGEKTFDTDWTTEGEGVASIAKSQFSNPMLKLTDTVRTTQKLTDLKAGQHYALYVGVDNRSDGNATMTVRDGEGKVLAENHTGRSIAKNYVKAYSHSTNSATVDGSSYFQNMYVFFDAPESGDVTLTLSHKGAGDAYFDDVRVVENGYRGLKTDGDGLVSLTNGFEKNAQGIWPFVVSGAEGVEDNRIHLSEKHSPYTQAGWDVKRMDDVLGGNWSVKINGLSGYGTLVYQTIPQNVRFEPGVTYRVSFDYQSGSDGIYAVAVGEGEYSADRVNLTPLSKALGTTSTCEFEITGGVTGDTWFGIQSTSTAADLQGTSGNEANFGGYKDFVLDNLHIERVDAKDRTKEQAQTKLDEVTKAYEGKGADYGADVWQTYQETLAQAKALIAHDGATVKDYTKAYGLLDALDTYMKGAAGDDSNDAWDVATNAYATSAGSEQPLASGVEGPQRLAQDGNTGTYWHTKWGTDAVGAGDAWYQFDLNEPTTVTGLRYLPRPGAANANGKILRYDITVTTEGGEQKTVVTDGEFSSTTTWQKVMFDEPVANVTSVRLTVKASTGQSAGETNHYASAAELRLTTEREVPAPSVTVDKADLDALIKEAGNLTGTDWTKDTWATLTDRLEAAKAVSGDGEATLYDVALASMNLQAAIDGLKPASSATTDKSALQAVVNLVGGLDESLYTPKSWEALETALKAANGVLGDPKASQTQVDGALDALQKAVQGLEPAEQPEPEPEPTDLTALQAAVELAGKLDESLWTESSWDAVQAALKAANAVLADEDASQDKVDAAFTALMEAIGSLDAAPAPAPEPAPVDLTALKAAIGLAGRLDRAQWTEASWANVQEALEKAKATAADESVTQEQANAAFLALMDALGDLERAEQAEPTPEPEPTPDPSDPSDPDTPDTPDTPATVSKDRLEALIGQAGALDLNRFTAESARTLREALAAAQTVFADEDATQEQVDAAARALSEAIAGLKSRPAADPEAAPSVTGPEGPSLSRTGASVTVVVLATLAALAAGTALTLRRRHRA